ncbi:zeatin O-glucosyltransferase-like [Camellia sinensis]|uniref:zeatin O-glucosyltransferase-like n=1 Tax=Camellia sinensis TaxID=4442 RepID=UPI001036B425|nr:zeatin O-glucosyltransferase-like [Camellia sinensis]
MEVQDKQHPSHDEEQVVVIMVPFPSQSHLNQLLELSCLISSYNIPDSQFTMPKFPTSPNLSPSPFESSFHLRQPVASLLQKISPTTRRVIIIHDVVMAYVIQDGATLPNVESFAFNPISAIISFFDGWKVMGKPFQKRQEVPEGLPSMQDSGVTAPELVNLSSLHSDFRSGSIINSCRSIEGPYIDLLEKEHIAADQKQWAIGPLNLYDSINSKGQHKCLEWLDKQAPNSVLYVWFGSTTSMTDEQIKELAIGLEQSEQKFIWVFRHADEGSIFSEDVKRGELPEGNKKNNCKSSNRKEKMKKLVRLLNVLQLQKQQQEGKNEETCETSERATIAKAATGRKK